MNCPICGVDSDVVGVKRLPHEHRIEYVRVCEDGHKFKTVEVHVSQLADKRELECATRTISRRIALYQRNKAIANDERPIKDIASDYDLTEARVRQIRAYMPSDAERERFAKIVSPMF